MIVFSFTAFFFHVTDLSEVQYGKMIMDALEEHARTSGYSVIELASLNVWLTDKYYRDRGYVEKEHPCSDLDEERHPTSACSQVGACREVW